MWIKLYKVPYPPHRPFGGGGEFIKSVKFWRVAEYNVEKKGRVKLYHFSYNIKAVGKNIKLGRGEGDGIFGEENKDLKLKGL